jgi:hypothetical protein
VLRRPIQQTKALCFFKQKHQQKNKKKNKKKQNDFVELVVILITNKRFESLSDGCFAVLA